MLCGHLSSLPRYLAGYSFDHPGGNPSETGSVSDSTHSFWKEARLGKPRCVVDPRTWTINESNFSVAWGSLHYGKCLPGDKKMILHYLF